MTRPPSEHPILHWPGKSGRRLAKGALPLVAQTAYGQLSGGGWNDLLVQADNLPLLSSLLHGPLLQTIRNAGGLKLIYCDPPFAVGTDFSMRLGSADSGVVHGIAYSDSWEGGLPAFLSMLYDRLGLMRDLLDEDGSLFLHCDWRAAPHLRLLLDEIFGPDKFLGDIVWHYTGGGRSKRWFSRKHDRILHYRKGKRWTFNVDAVRVPYKKSSGYAKSGITSAAGRHYAPNPKGTPADDVWDIPMINPLAKERVGYPTQKPEALLDRIIRAASNPGDLVADFFCGSGTTAVCAAKTGRRFIVSDSSGLALHCTRKRLLSLPPDGCAPAIICARLEDGDAGVCRHEAPLEQGRFQYALSAPRLRIREEAAGPRAVLEGFDVAALCDTAGAGQALPEQEAALLARRGWPFFLDGWGLGRAEAAAPLDGCIPDGLYNHVLWHSFGTNTAPPAQSDPLPLLRHPQELVLVITDIFGNTSRFTADAIHFT